MAPPFKKDSGISLTEMIVVLAIVGILSTVGVVMIGNRPASAVRALMDEVEGSLDNAHKAAVASGRDVALVSWGSWDAADPLVLTHGDAAMTDANIQTTAKTLISGGQPDAAIANSQTVAVAFRVLTSDDLHSRARIVVNGTSDWADASTGNQALGDISPFKDVPGFSGMAAGTDNLCKNALNRVVISGSNRRFASNVVIGIVATRNGGVIKGGPQGAIVIQANGGSIYRFYNPGIKNGDGQWRRI